MADEPKTTETPEGGKVVFDSQADLDAIIERRLAREKAKYADYDQTKETLDKLLQEKKQRDEKDLSEQEKLKSELEGLKAEKEELKAYKVKIEEIEKKTMESVAKKIEELKLSEDDINIIKSLPLDMQLSAITRITGEDKPKTGIWGKGKNPTEELTAREVYALRLEHGASSPVYLAALNKLKK
jgi:hypothetical protein